MAGQNVIAEIKAMRAEWGARVRELKAEIRVVNRTFAVGALALGLLLTVLQLLVPLVR